LERIRDINVIIPTLNEGDAIGPTIDEVMQYVQRENIIVVDGNSTDNTREEVEKRGVRFFTQSGSGKADAIRHALKYVDKEYVLVMDGDYTYPAKYIKDLYNTIKSNDEIDHVIGVRNRKRQGLIYRFGNWFLIKFFDVLFSVHLDDVLSGMYIVRRKALEGAVFEMKGFSIESEIAAHISSLGNKIAQVSIEYRERLGEKKLGVRHGIKIAVDIIRLSWRYNPVMVFFSAASLLMIPGLIIGSYAAFDYFFLHVDHFVKAIIAVVLVGTGFQSLMLAILSLYLRRVEMRIKGYLKKQ